MPYIPDQQRCDIHDDLQELGMDFIPENAGEVNYIVSELINNYLRNRGTNYATINEMMGALECAKLELYRVLAAPYEDKKMCENGPVYGGVQNA